MIINVVIRNIDNTIYKVDCIKYVDDIKDVSFLSDVLAEKYNKQKEMKNYFCDYDIECKKKYLSKLGEKSGKIVLSVDFNTLSFEEYFRITRDDSITINCISVVDGIGSASGPAIFDFFIWLWENRELISNFIGCFYFVFILFNPYYKIKKEFGYGKNFLYDIISTNYIWNYKFLMLDGVKFSNLIEIVIMFKFGYKLRNKRWEKRKMIFSTPRELLTKYNEY